MASEVPAGWSRSALALRSWLPALALLVLGMWLIPVQHTCQLSCVPGDYGDARFNGVVLEHFHLWLTGQEPSLLSPTFFHPMPGASTFSDNHWGTAWIYAAFRGLGADRYQAFDLWYLVGFALNFIVCHVVFRRMRFSPLASALGAFAFTFAMPVLYKHGHAQLTYRFLLPVGLLLWQRCMQDGRWRWFAALSLVVMLQLSISIYLGYFLLLLLVAWLAADLLLDRSWPSQWLARWWRERQRSSQRECVLSVVIIVLAGAAVIGMLYPYLHYARLYGFGRSLGEVATMTPRPESYLLADFSRLWGPMSLKIGTGLPARQEHQLFFGVGLLGLALLGALRNSTRTARLACVSLLLLFLLTITIGRYSLYLAVALMPGVGAIRAVSRIVLVMALPLAILVAMAVDAAPAGRWGYRGLVAVLALAMGLESVAYNVSTYNIEDAKARIRALDDRFPRDLPANAVVFNPLRPDEAFYATELDAVILGQERNLPTLNGYSGNYPPGYQPEPELPPCEQAQERLLAAQAAQHRRRAVPLTAPLPDAAWVAGEGRCAASD